MTRTLNFLLWTRVFSSTFTVTGYFPPLCSFTVTLESEERFPKLSIFEWNAEHLPSRIHAWHHPLVVRKFTLYISSTLTLRRRKGNPKLSSVLDPAEIVTHERPKVRYPDRSVVYHKEYQLSLQPTAIHAVFDGREAESSWNESKANWSLRYHHEKGELSSWRISVQHLFSRQLGCFLFNT